MSREQIPMMLPRQQFSAAQMRAAERRDLQRASMRKEAVRIPEAGGRLGWSADFTAVMNAVRTEGPEVLSEAGRGYWDDMKRRHPHIAQGAITIHCAGLRNRFGRVKERKVYG